MKRTIAALIAGLALGTTGIATAAGDQWFRNGVLCTTTGTGSSRGIVCQLQGHRKVVVVNQHSIIVGRGTHVLYLTSP